jgi:hypothetical protein
MIYKVDDKVRVVFAKTLYKELAKTNTKKADFIDIGG